MNYGDKAVKSPMVVQVFSSSRLPMWVNAPLGQEQCVLTLTSVMFGVLEVMMSLVVSAVCL